MFLFATVAGLKEVDRATELLADLRGVSLPDSGCSAFVGVEASPSLSSSALLFRLLFCGTPAIVSCEEDRGCDESELGGSITELASCQKTLPCIPDNCRQFAS